MNDIINFLNESIAVLESLKDPARREAKRLFPKHPKAQEVWVKLCCGGGGIRPVVETLQLQQEFEVYSESVNKHIRNRRHELASICISNFVSFCKDMVRDNFYMFK